jgi:hypothetical protein
VEKRRAQAEQELRCLVSPYIQHDWVIDTSDIPLEEVYATHFQAIVETGE